MFCLYHSRNLGFGLNEFRPDEILANSHKNTISTPWESGLPGMLQTQGGCRSTRHRFNPEFLETLMPVMDFCWLFQKHLAAEMVCVKTDHSAGLVGQHEGI